MPNIVDMLIVICKKLVDSD